MPGGQFQARLSLTRSRSRALNATAAFRLSPDPSYHFEGASALFACRDRVSNLLISITADRGGHEGMMGEVVGTTPEQKLVKNVVWQVHRHSGAILFKKSPI